MFSKKTGMRCSVKYCENKARARTTSFFKYPNDERLATWISNCKTEDLTEALHTKNSYKVCGDHFEYTMFLNPVTRNRLVFNAIPTQFNQEILFERRKAAYQCKIASKSDDGLKNQCVNGNLVPKIEHSPIRPNDDFDIMFQSCFAISTTDFSSQTPRSFSSNTPKRQKLVVEVKTQKKEIIHLKKTIKKLNRQLSKYETEENFLKLSKKYLSPGVFAIVKSQIKNKKKSL